MSGHAQSEQPSFTVRITAHAGETGRLFGAITPEDIAEAIKAAGGPPVDRRNVQITAPIGTVGANEVDVRVSPEVSATVSLELLPD